jgi:N-sulfoglucosamine sulfohydrolase
MRRRRYCAITAGTVSLGLAGCTSNSGNGTPSPSGTDATDTTETATSDPYSADDPPNILFAFADDWGPHASAYADLPFETPNFDRVAEDGALFNRAFCASPSCTPSRGAILSGQHIWQLGPGANLGGTMPADTPVYPALLEAQAGYEVGRTGKGLGPSALGGWDHDPAGEERRSLSAFLDQRSAEDPFCFWHGAIDPHRPYNPNLKDQYGIDPDDVDVPPDMPDSKLFRHNIADYYAECKRFDDQVGSLLDELESRGELDNTVVVVSGDHGWPFVARGKTNLYDMGTQVPLAVRWPDEVEGGTEADALVNLRDLARTFLDVAGVSAPDGMGGHSLVPVLRGTESGSEHSHWEQVYTGRERHARWKETYNPMRAVRTDQYLYIRNYDPEAVWRNRPRGEEGLTFDEMMDSYLPTNRYWGSYRDDPEVRPLYELAYDRPAEELYDVTEDPYQMNNLATDPDHEDVKERLRAQLIDELEATGDPRETDAPVRFDEYAK